MRLALLGATGAVGRTMLQVLEERGLPVDELVPLASARSSGSTVRFRGREWPVREPAADAFDGCRIALFSAGAARSREWAPVAAEAGATVIDNSSAWRMDPEVPLVVPEVNGRRAPQAPRRIIANPNCSTIQLVLALEAIRRAAPLRNVVATTFQSVSGAGQKGVDALHAELRGEHPAESPFNAPIAGNVIPSIGPRDENGWNEEELKMRLESRKILELPELRFSATCVRVPVDVGHSIAATVETERELTVAEAARALARMEGLELLGRECDALPLDGAGRDVVRVSRLRADLDRPNVLHFWVVGDNLRKGAATNAVQIAEAVLRG